MDFFQSENEGGIITNNQAPNDQIGVNDRKLQIWFIRELGVAAFNLDFG